MNMQKWVDYKFESSTVKTPEFKSFARAYKKALQDKLGDNFEIMNWSVGHFHISAFIFNKINKKYVYLSCPDVRWSENEWRDNILIRTAQNETDYTGGVNHFTVLDELLYDVSKLSV